MDSESKENVDFPKYYVIESLNETLMTKLFPFLIEKVLNRKINPKMILKKKIQDDNLLIEIETINQSLNLENMRTFHNINI